jgi:acyl carrier protein
MMNEEICKIIRKYLQIECENLKVILKDIEKWDSLTHIQLLTEIESFLGLSFDFEEIDSIQTLQDIFNLVQQKRL